MSFTQSVLNQLDAAQRWADAAPPYWRTQIQAGIAGVRAALDADLLGPWNGATCQEWSSPTAGLTQRANFKVVCGGWVEDVNRAVGALGLTLTEYNRATGQARGAGEVMAALLDEGDTTLEQFTPTGPPEEKDPWWKTAWDSLPPGGKLAVAGVGVAGGVWAVGSAASAVLPIVRLVNELRNKA